MKIYFQKKIQEIKEGNYFNVDMFQEWRKNVYDACQVLHFNEAQILTKLDKTREEFIEAIDDHETIQKKLDQCRQEYEKHIDQLDSNHSNELGNIALLIEERENEILELENLTKENDEKTKTKFLKLEEAEQKLQEIRNNLESEKKNKFI